MTFYFRRYFIVAFFLFLIGTTKVTPLLQHRNIQDTSQQISNIQVMRILHSVQQRYAPDLQLAVFNISMTPVETGMIVRGEVDNPAAKTALILALHKVVKGKIVDSISVLPDPDLGPASMGIVLPSIANVRRKPAHQEELLTQALMGTVLKVLKKEHGYYFIQTPDHYLGWIDSASVLMTDHAGVDAWNAASKVIVTKLSGAVYAQADTSSVQICELIAGCILKNGKKKNEWRAVARSDGTKGYVLDSLVQDMDEWMTSRVPTGENLEKTARSFLGIRYLWGGMSVRGMDCSGFIKMVYHVNGVELNRDSRQQAQQGIPIDPGENFQNLKKGDLLFFGRKATAKRRERITHVALYLENGLFIHSSKRVRLSSVNPSSDYYEEQLLKRFVRARRILQN
jgi:gamma-D-glutamyl-L-lysine dipeptidyl-peptidase